MQGRRPDLRADCANCFGLCCVALPFAVSADFAIDKDAGQPCPNLQPDFHCGIHTRLRERGFSGCTVFDCFGAGQKVSQVTFGGRDWREAPATSQQMFAVFPVMRQLHELLRYLTEAAALPTGRLLHRELTRFLDLTDQLTQGSAEELLELDVAAHRDEVNDL
ncbi:MAG TPA: pentapeptide repeat-containing protein, partial [Streptomyces sp.]|nr:pentapeptide repeat-containing protein [Streptomyces sp.]